MIKRLLFEEAEETAKEFKIVSVTGPRQSGKTTLAKAIFPDKPYASLEEPDVRLAAREARRSLFSTSSIVIKFLDPRSVCAVQRYRFCRL